MTHGHLCFSFAAQDPPSDCRSDRCLCRGGLLGGRPAQPVPERDVGRDKFGCSDFRGDAGSNDLERRDGPTGNPARPDCQDGAGRVQPYRIDVGGAPTPLGHSAS